MAVAQKTEAEAQAGKAAVEGRLAALSTSLVQAESRAESLSRQLASTAAEAGQRSALLVLPPAPLPQYACTHVLNSPQQPSLSDEIECLLGGNLGV